MKKILSLVLALSLVLGCFAPVFADVESQYAEQGQLLNDLGVLTGDENGLRLEDSLSRQELIVMSARLMGEEGFAKNFNLKAPFEDVDHPFFAPYIAWAWAKNLTTGYVAADGTRTFKPTNAATLQEVQIYLLRVLGFDPTWGETPELAAEVGLMNGLGEGTLTRGYFAALVDNALDATKADESGTLAEELEIEMPRTIVKVAAPEAMTVVEGEELTLPETLVATLDNGATKDVAVTWAECDTTVVGEATVAGTVENYGKVTAAYTVEAAIYDFGVESVTTSGLNQIVVKFNKEVDKDSATNVANYTLVTSGNAVIDADSTFALQSDKKTVIITMELDDSSTIGVDEHEEAQQQEKVDLTIEDVQDTNENKIAKTTVEDIQFLDTTLPQPEKAEVVGNDTIKVTFTEPIELATKADFEVDGGDLYIKSVTLLNNNTEANVQLYAVLEEGSHTIDISAGVEDFAGFGVIPNSFDVTVTEDEVGPVVIGYEDAKPTEVTLIFDEDIEIYAGDTVNFYHTNENNEVDTVITDADNVSGNKLTLKFTDNNLPEGTAYIYVAKKAVNDLWDNTNAKQMIAVEVAIDEDAPTLCKVEVKTQTQIKLTFSEDVADVERADFTVLDEDGNELRVRSVAVSDEYVTVNFFDNLSGVHTIAIEGIEDLAGNEIDKTTDNFKVNDLVDPVFADFKAVLYNKGIKGQMVKISFGETMATEGKYSVLDVEKYVIDGYVLADLDVPATIDLVDGGKAIEITVPSLLDDADGVNLTATSLKMARVADSSDNYTAELTEDIAVVSTYLESGTVNIKYVDAIDVNTIAITFTDEFAAFDIDDLILYAEVVNAGYAVADDTELTVAKVSLSLDASDRTVATITIDEDLDFNGTYGGNAVKVATVGSVNSVNNYGEKLIAGYVLGEAYVTAADYITPAVATDANGYDKVYALDNGSNGKIDTLVIEYEEAMNAAIVNKFSYTVENITVTDIFVSDEATVAGAIYDATPADGKFVVITLDENDSDLIVDTTYVPTVDQVLDIYDANENVLEAGALLESMDNAAPHVTASNIAFTDDTVGVGTISGSITFDAATDETDIVKYVVTITDGAKTIKYNIAANGSANYEVVIIPTTISGATTITVDAEDAAGNVNSTLPAFSVTDL